MLYVRSCAGRKLPGRLRSKPMPACHWQHAITVRSLVALTVADPSWGLAGASCGKC